MQLRWLQALSLISLSFVLDIAPTLAAEQEAASSLEIIPEQNNTNAASRLPPHKYIFSFGDSLSHTSFDPYGPPPTESCPMGDLSSCLEGSSQVGGYTWVSALTTVYNKSTTLTYNFAQASHVVDSDVINNYGGIKQQQVGAYRTAEQRGKNWDRDNALYVFWLGVSDIEVAFREQNSTSWLHEVANSYFELMDTFVNDFLAKHILFVTIPPIYRYPRYGSSHPTSMNDISEEEYTRLVVAVHKINQEINRRVIQFAAVHAEKGVRTYVWDSFSSFHKILDNLSAHGFTDEREVCADECFWYDESGRLTERAQLLFAEEVAGKLERERFW